jgi:hypothetical protein
MAFRAVRTPGEVAADIARLKRWKPDQDTTELYQELATANLVKKAREIVAKFPRPTEDQIQAIAEILRGTER